MTVAIGRATVPEPAFHTAGAKALRIAIDASAEAEANRITAEAWQRKAEQAEGRALSGVTLIDVALEAYRHNKQMSAQQFVDYLLEVRKRLWTEAS